MFLFKKTLTLQDSMALDASKLISFNFLPNEITLKIFDYLIEEQGIHLFNYWFVRNYRGFMMISIIKCPLVFFAPIGMMKFLPKI